MTPGAAGIAVMSFDEPLPAGTDRRALLGGKGAGLVEMCQLGMPVPPGFVITTDVCRHYLVSGWPEGLDQRLVEHLERLGERMGRRLGDRTAPLLVSVRSGAPISMPGMMDTLLNVGMTPEIRDRLAEESGDEVFAADTWLRFCRMYAETVLGIPRGIIAAEAASDLTAKGINEAAERLLGLAASYAGSGIPLDPLEQVRGAIEAVFRSWNSERACVFRAEENIPDHLGTAVTVQSMVFGNLDERSGTGVVFTRDPATGDPRPFGDYLVRAQGDDVVAGTHAVGSIDALREQLPEVHAQLLEVLRKLEHHYRDMCDVEFTVSGGKLYILQTRIGRRSPLAAARIAVAMAEEPDFPLTRAEACSRVGPDVLLQLSAIGRVDPAAQPIGRGLAASPGIGVGVLTCDPDRAAELSNAGTPVVLARAETSPADIHGMVGASGLLTTLGGVASHAAVVARGWAIPAITSLEGAVVEDAGLRIGELFVPEGECVTLDGTTGVLYLGDCREEGTVDIPEVRILREWAGESGPEAATQGPAPSLRSDVSLLEVARTVQLKGLCTAARAAATLFAEEEVVDQFFDSHPTFFKETPRGFMLTPEGRDWVLAEVGTEQMSIDHPLFETCYQRFLALNDEFKKLVSGWQMAGAAGQGDEERATLVGSLERLHERFAPILADTGRELGRLVFYGRRFEQALDALRAGDMSMLASPIKDSYHTVWFEYHEELIALTGRDRAVEEQAELEGRGR